MSAHSRAVRNCPWTVALWSRYLLALERHGVEHRVISGADCFCGKMSKLFVPSQERWAVTESLTQPSPGVYFGIFVVSDKKGSK